ncbi:MAG: OB-fold domain-containing protein [Chloroflexi bacterium]|nr:OB-fold domain-containing protein [Chloroflexota bacterium]
MNSPSDAAPTPQSAMPQVLRLLDAAGTQGVLIGSRCRRCGATSLGQQRACANCAMSDLETVDLSTRGALMSFTIVHRAAPSWPGPVPYALGEVELPESVTVNGEVVGCPFEALHVGMAVELTVRVCGHDAASNPLVIHKFQPAG